MWPFPRKHNIARPSLLQRASCPSALCRPTSEVENLIWEGGREMHKRLQGCAQTQKSTFLRAFYLGALRISILGFPSGVAEGSPLDLVGKGGDVGPGRTWAQGCYRRGNFLVPIAGPNVPRGGTVGCKTATANHLNLAVSRKLEGKRGSDKPVQGCHPLTKQRKLKWLFSARTWTFETSSKSQCPEKANEHLAYGGWVCVVF